MSAGQAGFCLRLKSNHPFWNRRKGSVTGLLCPNKRPIEGMFGSEGMEREGTYQQIAKRGQWLYG